LNQETNNPQAPASGGKRKSKKFLVIYAAMLFLAAAVLILLSYLMEARNQNQSLTATNQEHQGTIRSALQKVEQMQEENVGLQEENAELRATLTELTRDRNLTRQRLDTRDRQLADLEEESNARQAALTRLWWLEHCWQEGDEDGAEAVLSAMETAGDPQHLPTENPLDPEGESPRARFEALKEKLD